MLDPMFNKFKMMFCWPVNGAASLLIALLFIQNYIQSYGQAGFDPVYSYSMSGMAPLPTNPMGYAHSMYQLPQDKTEVILVGDRGGKQHHHHHHHHHHKNVHHHHHGHQHSHGHNHNHDHKHDHDHKHGHNHNHNHGHKHDHKHAHGHNHHHNHAHGHHHNHGHNHNHKHAHILLHRQKHNYQQKHGHFHHHGNNHKNDFGNNNDFYQTNGNGHLSNEQNENDDVKQQDSENSYLFPPIKHQQYGNHHISNQEYQHNNLQNSNHYTKYPDHVPPSYVSTDSANSIPHNEKHTNVQQEHKFKVQYDETEQGGGHQDHYDRSTSNENASYETKEEDNAQDEHSQSNKNTLNEPGVQHEEEDVNKGVSSTTEQDKASRRFFHSKLNNIPLTHPRSTARPPRKNFSHLFPKSNIPSDRSEFHRLKEQDQNSDELSVEPQVNYGVRLGQNSYGDYHKKEASISAVSFLQENGGLITVGDDDPFLSVEKPLKLEDSNPEDAHHGESFESKLSSGRMTLTPEEDYRASIGKIDEVWNIPLFD